MIKHTRPAWVGSQKVLGLPSLSRHNPNPQVSAKETEEHCSKRLPPK